MPNIITTNEPEALAGDIVNQNYGYEYPSGLDLKPGSELHTNIVSQILKRARQSHGVISNRFDSWGLIDEKLTAYIPLTEKEREIRDDDRRKPVSIVVPVP